MASGSEAVLYYVDTVHCMLCSWTGIRHSGLVGGVYTAPRRAGGGAVGGGAGTAALLW